MFRGCLQWLHHRRRCGAHHLVQTDLLLRRSSTHLGDIAAVPLSFPAAMVQSRRYASSNREVREEGARETRTIPTPTQQSAMARENTVPVTDKDLLGMAKRLDDHLLTAFYSTEVGKELLLQLTRAHINKIEKKVSIRISSLAEDEDDHVLKASPSSVIQFSLDSSSKVNVVETVTNSASTTTPVQSQSSALKAAEAAARRISLFSPEAFKQQEDDELTGRNTIAPQRQRDVSSQPRRVEKPRGGSRFVRRGQDPSPVNSTEDSAQKQQQEENASAHPVGSVEWVTATTNGWLLLQYPEYTLQLDVTQGAGLDGTRSFTAFATLQGSVERVPSEGEDGDEDDPDDGRCRTLSGEALGATAGEAALQAVSEAFAEGGVQEPPALAAWRQRQGAQTVAHSSAHRLYEQSYAGRLWAALYDELRKQHGVGKYSAVLARVIGADGSVCHAGVPESSPLLIVEACRLELVAVSSPQRNHDESLGVSDTSDSLTLAHRALDPSDFSSLPSIYIALLEEALASINPDVAAAHRESMEHAPCVIPWNERSSVKRVFARAARYYIGSERLIHLSYAADRLWAHKCEVVFLLPECAWPPTSVLPDDALLQSSSRASQWNEVRFSTDNHSTSSSSLRLVTRAFAFKMKEGSGMSLKGSRNEALSALLANHNNNGREQWTFPSGFHAHYLSSSNITSKGSGNHALTPSASSYPEAKMRPVFERGCLVQLRWLLETYRNEEMNITLTRFTVSALHQDVTAWKCVLSTRPIRRCHGTTTTTPASEASSSWKEELEMMDFKKSRCEQKAVHHFIHREFAAEAQPFLSKVTDRSLLDPVEKEVMDALERHRQQRKQLQQQQQPSETSTPQSVCRQEETEEDSKTTSTESLRLGMAEGFFTEGVPFTVPDVVAGPSILSVMRRAVQEAANSEAFIAVLQDCYGDTPTEVNLEEVTMSNEQSSLSTSQHSELLPSPSYRTQLALVWMQSTAQGCCQRRIELVREGRESALPFEAQCRSFAACLLPSEKEIDVESTGSNRDEASLRVISVFRKEALHAYEETSQFCQLPRLPLKLKAVPCSMSSSLSQPDVSDSIFPPDPSRPLHSLARLLMRLGGVRVQVQCNTSPSERKPKMTRVFVLTAAAAGGGQQPQAQCLLAEGHGTTFDEAIVAACAASRRRATWWLPICKENICDAAKETESGDDEAATQTKRRELVFPVASASSVFCAAINMLQSHLSRRLGFTVRVTIGVQCDASSANEDMDRASDDGPAAAFFPFLDVTDTSSNPPTQAVRILCGLPSPNILSSLERMLFVHLGSSSPESKLEYVDRALHSSSSSSETSKRSSEVQAALADGTFIGHLRSLQAMYRLPVVFQQSTPAMITDSVMRELYGVKLEVQSQQIPQTARWITTVYIGLCHRQDNSKNSGDDDEALVHVPMHSFEGQSKKEATKAAYIAVLHSLLSHNDVSCSKSKSKHYLNGEHFRMPQSAVVRALPRW